MLNKVAEDYSNITIKKNNLRSPVNLQSPVNPQVPIDNNECETKCLQIYQDCGDEITPSYCGDPMPLGYCSQMIYAEFHNCMTSYDNPAHPTKHPDLCSWLSESCKCEKKYAQKMLAYAREVLACYVQKGRAAGIENCPCFIGQKTQFEQNIKNLIEDYGENGDDGYFCETHRVFCNQIGPQNENDSQKCDSLKKRLKILVENIYFVMINSRYEACKQQAAENYENERQFNCKLCECGKTRYREIEGIKFKMCEWLYREGCITEDELRACAPDRNCITDPESCADIEFCDKCKQLSIA